MDEPTVRRGAGLLSKAPSERARRHCRLTRPGLNGERPLQVRLRPIQDTGESAAILGADRGLDVLRLTTVAMRRNDEPSRDAGGDLRAVVDSHDVQTQVDPRCASRRGENSAFVNVERVRLDLEVWVSGAEGVDVPPMRRRPFAVEQPACSEHEDTRAKGHEPRALRVGAAKRAQDGRRR